MRIHHLNCGTLCPFAGRFVATEEHKLVCHCLLIETSNGLVLVDTGFGTDDIRHPYARLSKTVFFMRPSFDLEETAVVQVKKLGFKPEDVRHIVLTHLDMDHASGLPDFPHATVHVYGLEHAAAHAPRKTFVARHRYKSIQWAHGPQWELYKPQGEPWFGFEAVRELKGLPPEILMIPLTGHTRGHCGVAVQNGGRWLLHAGDAYFFHAEMDVAMPRCTPILSAFQKTLAADNTMRVNNQRRLRELIKGHPEVDVFCAHDALELKRF